MTLSSTIFVLMADRSKLADIILCCERRFDRGRSSEWRHGDYLDLSMAIHADTQVVISANTLKRIFGKIAVDNQYLPQQATLEALKVYGKYSVIERSDEDKQGEPASVQTGITHRRQRLFIHLVVLVAVVTICLISIVRYSTSDETKRLEGKVSLRGIEGLLPATAFFDLELPDLADSLFIDFGDKSPVVPVTSSTGTTAHNYLFPGVFTVTLRTKQKDVAKTRVSIRSNKWIGLGFRRQGDIPNQYYEFPALRSVSDSLFQISNLALQKMGLDTIGSFFTRICNFSPIPYDGEDFTFQATFKNTVHEKGIYCHGTQFQISGLKSMIRFKLVNPGCSYRVINVISEQTFEGSRDNLSKFVVDLEQWNTVKLVNQEKTVSLFVNDKLLYTGGYQLSLGKIQGLFLEFEGNGFIKNCSLSTPTGRVLYKF